MPTTTTTYSFNKPVVGADEDDWGGYLNGNWDSVDDLLDGTTPVTGIDINSGTLDGVTIGGTTAGAGTFTTLTANTSITGTLATAAQPNITSVGSLTSLDVAGTLTSDALTVDGGAISTGDFTGTAAGGIRISGNGTTLGTSSFDLIQNSSGSLILARNNETLHLGTNNVTDRLSIAGNGDISFYEDTGTTAKFFWDASAESLGIGTSSPSEELHITAAIPTIRLEDSDDGSRAEILYNTTSGGLVLRSDQGADAGSASNIIMTVDGSEAMRIDSSGNVGIGTSSIDAKLHVERSVYGGYNALQLENSNGNTGVLNYTDLSMLAGGSTGKVILRMENSSASGITDGELAIYTTSSGTTSEAMRIDSSGNVGIGTSSPATSVSGSAQGLAIQHANVAYMSLDNTGSSGRRYTLYSNTSGNLVTYDEDAASTRMIIDSSGNLLVGTTVNSIDTEGALVRASGQISACVDGSYGAVFQRKTSDGFIVLFRKDGANVGSIGSYNGDGYIGNGDTGITFADGSDVILPVNASTPAYRDAAISLGNSSYRFKDLYLSGGLRGDTTFKNNAGTTEYARFDSNETVFNEGGNDIDFRVESDNNSHMIFMDASTDQLFIRGSSDTFTAIAGGGVHLNTTSGWNGFKTEVVSNNYIAYASKAEGTNNHYFGYMANGSNQTVGSIFCNTTSTTYATSSDYRLKENVVELTGATERLKQLHPKRFNFIANPDITVDGFLAHEAQEVVPEAVTGTHNEVREDGTPEYQGIDQAKLVPLLVATIKELEARITALENA